MNVLHLFNQIEYSGAEIMYANASPIFSENGINQIAFSTGKDPGKFVPEFEKANIKIFHKPIAFGFFSIKSYKYYKDFYRFLKQENISVLHIHRNDLNFEAILARFAGILCIKTQHNTFSNRWFTLPYAIFLRYILRVCFKVIYQTIGESVYLNELNYYKNPSIRINNWFNSSVFFPASSDFERNKIRDELGISMDTFVFISTGGCSHIKNHHDIIRALAIVKDSIPCAYLHLGAGETSDEEKTLVKSFGLEDISYFLGNKINVRDYLIASDVYLMTSKFEGLSIASIEAMACKIPSVLYNSPGLRDLINQDDNGFLIAPDYKILAEKILLYNKNPQLATQKAERALSFVKREFNMRENVGKIIQLYKLNPSLK